MSFVTAIKAKNSSIINLFFGDNFKNINIPKLAANKTVMIISAIKELNSSENMRKTKRLEKMMTKGLRKVYIV